MSLFPQLCKCIFNIFQGSNFSKRKTWLRINRNWKVLFIFWNKELFSFCHKWPIFSLDRKWLTGQFQKERKGILLQFYVSRHFLYFTAFKGTLYQNPKFCPEIVFFVQTNVKIICIVQTSLKLRQGPKYSIFFEYSKSLR